MLLLLNCYAFLNEKKIVLNRKFLVLFNRGSNPQGTPTHSVLPPLVNKVQTKLEIVREFHRVHTSLKTKLLRFLCYASSNYTSSMNANIKLWKVSTSVMTNAFHDYETQLQQVLLPWCPVVTNETQGFSNIVEILLFSFL